MASKAKKMVSRRRPASSEAGEGSRAPAECRTKHWDDWLPELVVPARLNLTRAKGSFTKFVQPRYVDFTSLADLFPNLQPLFDTQGWTVFLYSHTIYSPTAVSEFFNNLGYSKQQEFYTSVKGIPFKLTANLFSTALQIPNSEADILTHHPSASEYYHLITLQPYDGTKKIAKLNANSFPPLNRMIHHIFTTLIAPKHGSRELVTEILHNALPVDSRIIDQGIAIVSKCSYCKNPSTEDINHLFIQSDLDINLWNWDAPFLEFSLSSHESIVVHIWNFLNRCNLSTPLGFISMHVCILITWEIWRTRCLLRIEGNRRPIQGIIHNIRYMISVSAATMSFQHVSAISDLEDLSYFGYSHTMTQRRFKLIRWIPPDSGLVLNVDGASKGNPGLCGGGGCIRDSAGKMLLGFAHSYGSGGSFLAEARALCDGIRLATEFGLTLSLIQSDSAALVSSLKSATSPSWVSLRWWREVYDYIRTSEVQVIHVYREANQVADALANYGCKILGNVYALVEWEHSTPLELGALSQSLSLRTPYVEDEEDDPTKVKPGDSDASDDEIDSDEPDSSYDNSEVGYAVGKERESFMDLLSALIVSEEFQGIVASETENSKVYGEPISLGPSISRPKPVGRNADFSILDSSTGSGGYRKNALLWFVVITSVAVLISINIGGSNFFNL
ncbi:hypothetical protein Taro_010399 [Colocasia esculenta]|uniref:RNase H type-1 domain-containing protein n=1 Tax=Colocasia esculenta TaxID=4460 RepID=A0A843UCY2_COLES|nr:hypothetical protein [Colocasia esculenta]